MVPWLRSALAMVSGMRSLWASARTITKLPARLALAIRGASIRSIATFGEKYFFSTIKFISLFLSENV